jgi:hypothetical protein
MANQEIIAVNSTSLQDIINRLLPSQNGFGSELAASNTIIPVIDLTAAAEGSSVPTHLQTALAFGSQTAIAATTGTTVLVNQVGFWRIYGNASINENEASAKTAFQLNDGSSVKTIWQQAGYGANGISASVNQQLDIVVFLAAGESLQVVCTGTYSQFRGSSRQLADGNGTLINPNGFPV